MFFENAAFKVSLNCSYFSGENAFPLKELTK